jgi:NADH-quinone oxidoreductase subunit D
MEAAVRTCGQLICVLDSEIGRLLSHLLKFTIQALDVGALTPILWAFEERKNAPTGYGLSRTW